MNITDKIYDKGFRNKLIKNPKKYYQSLNPIMADDIDIVVHENGKDVIYIVMPSQDYMFNESLANINAAGCASSAGSIGSLGCVGSVLTTASTISTAGTVGTAGSAGKNS